MKTNINMDFELNLAIKTANMDWTPSPNPNILRKPLESEEAESGHTTSIVKYMPNSSFKLHEHPMGEEIFVLSGTFSDENGNYSAGTYIRNPPGSSHQPFSDDGCTLFVKLNQFDSEDKQRIVIETQRNNWLQGQGQLKVMPLHQFATTSTALVKWPKGEKFHLHRHFGGEEILVLSGEFKDEHNSYPKHTWIRNKHLSQHCPWVDKETIILVKTGHLYIG